MIEKIEQFLLGLNFFMAFSSITQSHCKKNIIARVFVLIYIFLSKHNDEKGRHQKRKRVNK